jgi:rhodanese-related sulfurtransferase
MKKLILALIVLFAYFVPSTAAAQFTMVGVDEVTALMTGKGKAMLIDVRSPEEYRDGHIPGAINIPAERIASEKGRLPKDKAARLIFYCRGVG